MTSQDQLIQQVISIEEKSSASWNVRLQKKDEIDYDKFGIAGGDGFQSWMYRQLRFGDQLAAVCYSYGISWKNLQHNFPQIFSVEYHYNNLKGKDWPSFEELSTGSFSNVAPHIFNEIMDRERWDWHNLSKMKSDYLRGYHNKSYSPSIDVFNQLGFVVQQATRIPNSILEIGGGRGEISNAFSYLNVPCTSIEPGDNADFLYYATGKHFFGENFNSTKPLTVDLKTLSNDIDLSIFDTILFCESIEHIKESDFWGFWNKVCNEFQGVFIITNWIDYHPIPIMPPEHIFEINDSVYDKLVRSSGNCVFRNGSHLVLDMKKHLEEF